MASKTLKTLVAMSAIAVASLVIMDKCSDKNLQNTLQKNRQNAQNAYFQKNFVSVAKPAEEMSQLIDRRANLIARADTLANELKDNQKISEAAYSKSYNLAVNAVTILTKVEIALQGLKPGNTQGFADSLKTANSALDMAERSMDKASLLLKK